jgi:signal peptidase I
VGSRSDIVRSWLPALRRQQGSSLVSSLVEVVIIVGTAFILALLIQQFVVKPFYIPSESMENTLVKGDRVLVNRFIYRFTDPKPGDVVVFHPPSSPKEDYIKRVVAVAGDTVAVHDGKLYVNGVAKNEPYLKQQFIEGTYPPEGSGAVEQKIPPGKFWAMGDNRNQSGDSRVFGAVEVSKILGKAFMIYWPVTKIGGL